MNTYRQKMVWLLCAAVFVAVVFAAPRTSTSDVSQLLHQARALEEKSPAGDEVFVTLPNERMAMTFYWTETSTVESFLADVLKRTKLPIDEFSLRNGRCKLHPAQGMSEEQCVPHDGETFHIYIRSRGGMRDGQPIDVAQLFPFFTHLDITIKESFFTSLKRNCAGTLIHPKFILTAAHCVTPSSNVKSIKLTFEMPNGVKMTTEGKAFYVHPKYHVTPGMSDVVNDVAIVELDDAVAMISPVPVAPQTKRLYGHYPYIVVGQGTTDIHNLRAIPPKVMQANVHLAHIYDSGILEVTDLNFVTLEGDSGGPLLLVDPVTNQIMQVGVTSMSEVASTTAERSASLFIDLIHPDVNQWIARVLGDAIDTSDRSFRFELDAKPNLFGWW